MMQDINDLMLLVQKANTAKDEQEKLAVDIRTEFNTLQLNLVGTGGIITKDIEGQYKAIDRMFSAKQRQFEYQQKLLKEIDIFLGVQK